MKHTLIRIAPMLLMLATSPACDQGASTEWDELNQEFEELYRSAQYDRAAIVGKKALEIAEGSTSPNNPNVATSLNNLARL